jgi:glucokinase-like ROK family protein
MAEDRVLAFDIGGTRIKHGIVRGDGVLLSQDSLPTLAEEGGECVLARLLGVMAQQRRKQPVLLGVAISTAGQVNPADGSIRFSTDNLPGWTGMALARRVSDACGLPCAVENDVNAAALGEAWQGAARGARTALVVTLGTGIGGAILSQGELFYGSQGSAGELGHMCMRPHGLPCTCGQAGCFEQYASTAALERRIAHRAAREPGWAHLTARGLCDRARQGEAAARALLAEWLDDVAWGICALTPVLDPDVVVLGGGISAQGAFLTERIQRRVRAGVMPSYRGVRVRPAALGNAAGMIGAAHSLMRRIERDAR